MSLWSNSDANTSAPKSSGLYVNRGPSQSTSNLLYGNTQISAYFAGQQTGMFGVDTAEDANTAGEDRRVTHTGWNIRRMGMGPIVSITANTVPAGALSSGGFLTFSGGAGPGNATGNTVANASYTVASGNISAITIVSGGLYANTPAVVAIGAQTNIGFTVTMGGRANRVHYETIVAMGSMTTGVNTDNAILPP